MAHRNSDTAAKQMDPTTDLHAQMVESELVPASVELSGDAIYLNYRQLHDLPPRLLLDDVCAALHRLFLNHNLLPCLPPEIKKFQHLTEIYLRRNLLKILPEEEMCELRNLQILVASENHLSSLPPTIGRLRNLRRLEISRNKLRHLPCEIGDLQQLESLEVSYNQLSHLPQKLSQCSSLQLLSLDSNQLVILPRQLCCLKQLTEISATNNLLVSLPQDLGKMPALQTMYVDNNPFLKAIPASAQHKTIGFFRSGESAIPTQLQHLQHQVVLGTGQQDEAIPLPPDIRSVQHISNSCVPNLVELALRVTYRTLQASECSLPEGEIPSDLLSLLKYPTAHCQHCDKGIFVSAFPVIFQTQVQARSVLFLGLCCSSFCVRQCSLFVKLPLLYPRLEDLALALVLV